MNEMPIEQMESNMKEVMAEQIKMLDGNYDGDTVWHHKPKRLQPNNVRCKEKQIAKRRAKNKNKNR